jgi:hypothetical protein
MSKISYDAGKLRAQVYERAQGRCEITGMPLGESWALHHRRQRGMGGTARADTHTLSNVMALTHHIHNLGTPSVHLAVAWAYARGYLLAGNSVPRLEPVWLLGRQWALLSDEGAYLQMQMAAPEG